MDTDYVFLCGMIWCRLGQQDAGKKLLRTGDSGDPHTKALAWAMFAKGLRRLRERRMVMAKVIEFYVPKRFQRTSPGVPHAQSAKVIEFSSQTRKSA